MPTLPNAVFHRDDPAALPPIFRALDYLGEQEVSIPMLAKIRRIRRALVTAHGDYEGIRTDIIKRHGKEAGDGNFEVKPKTKGWDGFVKDYAELLEQTFEVSETITLDDLDGLRVKEKELRPLGDLLVLDEAA